MSPSVQGPQPAIYHTRLNHTPTMHSTEGLLQDVLGVLGCPNLPQSTIRDSDGEQGAAAKVGSDGIGCLFVASHRQGAYLGPLTGRCTCCSKLLALRCPTHVV